MHRRTEAIIYSSHHTAMLSALLTIVFSVALLLIGCNGSSPSVEPAAATVPSNLPSESATEKPQSTSEVIALSAPRSYVVEAGTVVPISFDPLHPADSASQRVTENIFDSLLNINAQNALLLPALAAEWSFSEDGLTATFRIRNDVQWHDGEPFTSEDVVFTFESLISADTDSPFKANIVPVDEFYAPDRSTFVATLDSADCSVLYDIGQIPIIPRHLFATKEGEEESNIPLSSSANWEYPIGTGPFKFKERLHTGEIHLERNDNYFAGAPHISEWVYQPFDNTQQILGGVREGEIDIAAISSQESRYFQQNNGVQLVAFPHAEYYTLMLNNAHPFLKDVRIRRALVHAIDRQELVQELLNGFGQVIDSSWLPDHWANTVISTSIEYDPVKAQELLREAGWTDSDQDGLLDQDGQPLQINISVNSENELRKHIALSVQRYWLDIGVSAELHFVEFHTLLEKLFARNFNAVTFSWPIHPDPDQSLFWASKETDMNQAFNFISYASPGVDEALIEGRMTPFCDLEARATSYQQVISTITEEQPFVFLFVPQDILAVNQRLSGLEPGPYSDLSWNINEWTLGIAENNS